MTSEHARPVCKCGHPPAAHGAPEFFGMNTICLVLGCHCDRYQDIFNLESNLVDATAETVDAEGSGNAC